MDFATVTYSDGGALRFDWVMDGPDLESDEGLETAVIISLFSDRQAAPDDVLPDNSGDIRGWWPDHLDDGAASDTAQPDVIGSRLWLLARAKATTQTAAQAQAYGAEALQWLVDDGVAASAIVTTTWLAEDQLGLGVVIARIAANGGTVNHQYDYVWSVGKAS